MITYDYFCPTNNQTITVAHSMKERLSTWGELCQKAGCEVGTTAADTPVERLISGGLMGMVSGGTSSSPLPMMGSCCGNPSSCGHHG